MRFDVGLASRFDVVKHAAAMTPYGNPSEHKNNSHAPDVQLMQAPRARRGYRLMELARRRCRAT